MGKKLLAYCCINVVAIICAAFFLRVHYNPEPFNDLGMTRHQQTKVVSSLEHGPRYTSEINFIAGSSALLLLGWMFWFFYRKIKKENDDCINECLQKTEKIEPISLRGWAIALLICPGGIILPVFIAVFFGFSHFW